MAKQPELPQPTVIIGDKVDPAINIDPVAVGQTMQELGISDTGIQDAVIYMDPANKMYVRGTHYPNKIGRLRLHSAPGIGEARGDIVSIGTKLRGKPRSEDKMNSVLVHELEHVAQQDRHDRKLDQGHLAIYGLAIAGAFIGNRLGKKSGNRALRVAAPILGTGFGHQLGYLIAPHERQARARQKEVQTKAITRE